MIETQGAKEQTSIKSAIRSSLLLALQSLATRIPKIIVPRIEEVYPELWTGTVNISNEQTSRENHRRNIKTEEHREFREDAVSNVSGINVSKTVEEIQSKDPHLCYVCNRNFEKKNDLGRHLTLHNLNLMHCKLCDEMCKDVFNLNEHYKIHLENSRHRCEVCGKKFLTYFTLKNHKLIHSDIFPFECKTCGRRYKKREGLELHSVVHSEECKYVCDKCDKSFKMKGHLQRHTKLVHKLKLYVCNVCDKIFKDEACMKTRMLSHKESTFTCTHCNKQFLWKSQVQIHISAVHLNIRNFKCNECDKEFSGRIDLIRHMRVHTGEQPYVCYCGKKFNLKYSLSTHMRLHTGEKPYVCECGRKFSRRNKLVAHTRVHTGERPYVCKCGTRFYRRDILNKHIRRKVCKVV